MTKRNKLAMSGILLLIFMMLLNLSNLSMFVNIFIGIGGLILYYFMISDK